MQKRYLPIAIVTGILFLVALGGYLAPAGSGGPPVRVLLENKGGKVILNHADHINDMDGQCADCHHTSGDDANPPACTDCHAAKFDAAFAANHQTALPESQCASCHHAEATTDNFSHDDHMGDLTGGDCQALPPRHRHRGQAAGLLQLPPGRLQLRPPAARRGS